MTNRYPFLAHWKRKGLDKEPTVPPEILLKRGEKKPSENHFENIKGNPCSTKYCLKSYQMSFLKS